VAAAVQGSAGNVLAAVASLIFPGLGQLLQGRPFKALLHLVLAGLLWVVSFGLLGWVMHVWSAIEAARWERPAY
jgi:TM2 domain-containing membrane protein YozV